jgi:hypothetical protein
VSTEQYIISLVCWWTMRFRKKIISFNHPFTKKFFNPNRTKKNPLTNLAFIVEPITITIISLSSTACLNWLPPTPRGAHFSDPHFFVIRVLTSLLLLKCSSNTKYIRRTAPKYVRRWWRERIMTGTSCIQYIRNTLFYLCKHY